MHFKHNRHDMIIWDNDSNNDNIIDVCVPLDVNVELRETTKVDNYGPLVDNYKGCQLHW